MQVRFIVGVMDVYLGLWRMQSCQSFEMVCDLALSKSMNNALINRWVELNRVIWWKQVFLAKF